MSDFVWEEPPPRGTRGGPRIAWMEELRPLTERPGEWARVRDWKTRASANAVARGINSRTIPLDPGKWETHVGRVGDGLLGDRWGLWVRYLGSA